MEKIDITKYPEGVRYLAETLDLPISKENTVAREEFVFNMMKGIITL